MKIHKNIRVKGKVQGVYFRASTRQKAIELEIQGIVKNEPDKSVYIEAEGEPDQISEFLKWCHIGPPAALVEKVEEEEEAELKNYHSFIILR